LALLATLTVVLTACTGSPVADEGSTAPGAGSTAGPTSAETGPRSPDQWRRSIPMRSVTVPAEMVATADRLDGGELVAGTADLPALVGAIRTSPDGRRHLEVSASDGTGWRPTDVGPGVPGDPQRAALAGSGSVSAVGGWTWEAGTVWPYLLTSTDRRTWASVPLPSTVDGHRIDSVATTGGRVVAVASNDAGDAATIIVDEAGAAATVTALPAVPQGQRRSLGSLAVSGDTLLLTGTQGPTGDGPVLAFRSPDLGRTWAEPVAISPHREAGVWGVVALPTGFLATGNDLVSDDPDKNKQMTAWFSPDGAAWNAESVPEPDGFRWDTHNAALGAPTAAGDYVLALAGSSNSRTSRLYQRQPSGEWMSVGETDEVADGVGRLGYVAPIAAPAGSDAPGGTFVTVAGAHGMVVGRLQSGVWTTTIEPALYRNPPYFSEFVGAGSPWRAVIRQSRFLPFGDGGFRTVNEPTLIGLGGDALTVLPWDPPEAGDWEDVEIATDGTAEVVLAGRLTENEKARQIGGWFRPAPGQPWQPVAGFGAQPDETLGEVTRIGDRWMLRGATNDRVGAAHDQAMLWTSTDGITWARADGDFADGDRSSGIDQICADPGGHPIAVGWIYLTAGTSTATAWTEQNGRWQRSILPTGPDIRSWFSTCTTNDDQLVIDGSSDGDEQRWTIDAGGTFQPVAKPVVNAEIPAASGTGEPFDLSAAQSVPGGHVATGRLDTAEYIGPVLWLSADGARWTWVPMPTAQPYSSLSAAVDGADLIVLSGSTNLGQAWRIPDIASVIASIPATG